MPIPVWNGDVVTITASGTVCPSSWDDHDCVGPDGAPPGRWTRYNYRDFQDAPHASLVAAMPGQIEGVGSQATFRVEESGWLLLFVNDTDAGNNKGAFQVAVTVEAPR